ncbi:MAG: hypothetical protein LBL83_11400 [Clostridiales bacterium]|jgi:hypothetical protein|nr:hypothetical protein [Clostridiales bacterium]
MIDFEWEKNCHGQDILVARKKRGKISIAELQEAMGKDCRYRGGWAAIFAAREESGYQGWGGGEEPKGDALELYRVEDWATCPICAAAFCGIELCPHCGMRIKEETPA